MLSFCFHQVQLQHLGKDNCVLLYLLFFQELTPLIWRINLETTELWEGHSAINLPNELTDTLTRWNLQDSQLVAATTDNVRNIANALGY